MDDTKFVAAILAAARLAKDADQSPEHAAKIFGECVTELEKSGFRFPKIKPAPDEIVEDDVDPTRLTARQVDDTRTAMLIAHARRNPACVKTPRRPPNRPSLGPAHLVRRLHFLDEAAHLDGGEGRDLHRPARGQVR